MAMKTQKPSEMLGLVGVIDPDAYSAATYTTGWIDMSKWLAIHATVMAGTLGASATVDAKLEQAQDGSGTGAKDVTGSAITQLTKAGSDDDKQAIIEMFQEDMDHANAFTHVRLSVTVGTATSDMGAMVLGVTPRYAPASGSDLASVDEIVTV